MHTGRGDTLAETVFGETFACVSMAKSQWLPAGLATAFWARRFGSQRVVVIASSHRRESLALELGATGFLSSEEASGDAVSKACNGLPDIVFECVGKPGLIAVALEHAPSCPLRSKRFGIARISAR